MIDRTDKKINKTTLILSFDEIDKNDVAVVGGKNSSLGEIIQQLQKDNISVPDGFATTSDLFRQFITFNKLDEPINKLINAYNKKLITTHEAGTQLRKLILDGVFSENMSGSIKMAYENLSSKYGEDDVIVAVRSSATAEDLPEASFAGQHDSFLNVEGVQAVLENVKKCMSSIFTDRAIVYREENGFDHLSVAISVGIQKMVRSDQSSSGVIFTVDTETGFPHVVLVTASWGLGEMVVQGAVNPDEFMVFKPLLSDQNLAPLIKTKIGAKKRKMITKGHTTQIVNTTDKERDCLTLNPNEILTLARWSCLIEDHYQHAMDIEWAKDIDGQLYIVQARPETVQSRQNVDKITCYQLKEKGKSLLEGIAIGEAITVGQVQKIDSANDIDQFQEGNILVTQTTDPDWVPIMKIASGIITNLGGRTSHAAIVSRELSVPIIVGTETATTVLKNGQDITLSCAEGETGHIYEGQLDFDVSFIELKDIPPVKIPLMLNIADPSTAFHWWALPAKGIGLARMEFVINHCIGIHPMALVHPASVQSADESQIIKEKCKHHKDPTEYFVDNLSQGIAQIACTRWPEKVIVRLSDFKTNEYENLIGGRSFESKEPNPMIGFRGASRYIHPKYKEAFALECRALKKVRDVIGLKNITIMVPFCRTLKEADAVLEALENNGLKRGLDGLEIYVMAEIPANIILAEEFSQKFDGFSIGTNDLTQLILGIDRDSSELANEFDARNDAVKKMIAELIHKAHKHGTHVGICGQAPSDHPDFADFLLKEKIDSISLNPDSVATVAKYLNDKNHI